MLCEVCEEGHVSEGETEAVCSRCAERLKSDLDFADTASQLLACRPRLAFKRAVSRRMAARSAVAGDLA